MACAWNDSKRCQLEHAQVGTNLERELVKVFEKAVVTAFPQVAGNLPKMLITPGKQTEYQCNNAMGLAKQLSSLSPPVKMTPQQVAEAIGKSVDNTSGIISNTQATERGFLNIGIGLKYVEKAVAKLIREGVQPPVVEKQRVLVDFSSPNIAKVMHVGHLRSTIIGDGICRLLEFCGHDVLRVNHVGDWGTQFGMLIAHLKSVSPDFLTNPPDIKDLLAFYKEAKKRFDDEDDFRSVSHQEVVKLQSGDETNLAAWKMICDVSRKEFNTIYEKLDVKLEEFGESFYNPIIPKVLKLLEEGGHVKTNEGAKIIAAADWKPLDKLGKTEPASIVQAYLINAKGKEDKVAPGLAAAAIEIGAAKEIEGVLHIKAGKNFISINEITHEDTDKFVKEIPKLLKPLHPKILDDLKARNLIKDPNLVSVPVFNVPLIVQKSDGGYSYGTTDVAAAWYRIHELKVDRVAYVIDLGQELHLKMVYRAAEDAGWTKREGKPDVRLEHVGFGVVCGPDKKKYKTRSGDTASLADLLKEGIERSYNISVKRQKEKKEEAEERAAKGDLRDEFVPFTEEELQEISETVGLGAIKYCDLRQNRTNDYVFNSDKMCSLDGNTAMAMLYAFARTCSLARKAGVSDIDKLKESTDIVLELECEKKLGICLLKFPSVVEKTCDNLLLHNLTDYLYELVGCFNDCYNQKEWKVVGHPLQNSRLLLCDITGCTIKKGLSLIGIKTVTKI